MGDTENTKKDLNLWGLLVNGYWDKKLNVWGVLHWRLAWIHILVAIVVGVALQDEIDSTKQDVFFSRPILQDGGESGGFDISTKKNVIFRVSPILIHVIVSALTGISHFASYFTYYTYGICDMRPNKIRWFEYSITATLMTLSGYISLGEGDIMFLTTITLLGITLQFCGYLIEQNVATLWYPIFMVAVLIEAAIVLPMIVLTDQMENRKQGLVMSLVFYALYYSLFAVNCLHDAWRFNNPDGEMLGSFGEYIGAFFSCFFSGSGSWDCCLKQDQGPYKVKERGGGGSTTPVTQFMKTDEYYAVLSFTSKQALFWITIATVMMEATNDDEQTGWEVVLWLGCALPLLGLVIYYGYTSHLKIFSFMHKWWSADVFSSETRETMQMPIQSATEFVHANASNPRVSSTNKNTKRKNGAPPGKRAQSLHF